jgi:hypothetical protein
MNSNLREPAIEAYRDERIKKKNLFSRMDNPIQAIATLISFSF